MWPFDRKKKKEEAARKAEAERQLQLARLRQAERPARQAGMSRAFEAPYGGASSAPVPDDTSLYAAMAESVPSPSPSHHSSHSHHHSSHDSHDSGSSDSGSCGGGAD